MAITSLSIALCVCNLTDVVDRLLIYSMREVPFTGLFFITWEDFLTIFLHVWCDQPVTILYDISLPLDQRNIFSESPADFIEKMKGSPALHFHISKDGDTWVWEAHIGEFRSKTVRKKGEAHPLGAHAPGYKVRKSPFSTLTTLQVICGENMTCI